MPSDLPIDLEINLKKRARRRLVGAIALVLLMLIILPIILQDRSSVKQTEAIKITMSEPASEAAVLAPMQSAQEIVEPTGQSVLPTDLTLEAPATNDAINQKVAEIENATPKINTALAETKPVAKVVEAKSAEPIAKESKPVQVDKTGFTIQIGVYSDSANVKQLQDKLTQAGFTSSTEKVATSSGEKIRLNAGSYATREAASSALEKLKTLKIAGFVKAKT